jgi:cell division protein FtsQ
MRRLSFPRRGWLPAAVCVLLLLIVGLFWLRDSPLVGVDDVTITGASGPDAPRIERALRSAARDMTTLNIDRDELEESVEAFPTVNEIKVERDFPSRLRIEVVERSPVAVIGVADDRVPVTAGGTELRGATAPDDLPLIDDDEHTDEVLRLLAAAPKQLLRRADRAGMGSRGLTVRMAEGPLLYFGPPVGLEAKWAAAARVLADPTAEGASYVDVRVPERTAAGGIAPIESPEEAAAEDAAAEEAAAAGAPAPGAETVTTPPETTPTTPVQELPESGAPTDTTTP